MKTTPEPLLYSILDAAAAIGICRSTIYEMLADGRLEAVKIGSRRLVVAESLDAFVNSLRQAA